MCIWNEVLGGNTLQFFLAHGGAPPLGGLLEGGGCEGGRACAGGVDVLVVEAVEESGAGGEGDEGGNHDDAVEGPLEGSSEEDEEVDHAEAAGQEVKGVGPRHGGGVEYLG